MIKHLFIQQLFLILILVAVSESVFSNGLGDWELETPGGNAINNFSGINTTLLFQGEKDLENLDRWYFLNNAIIGETGESSREYFILNETTNGLYLYNDKNLWQKKIHELDLKPKYWTRWYNSEWIFFNGALLLMVVIFSIPLLLLAGILYVVLKSKNIKNNAFTYVTKVKKKLLFITITTLYIRYLLDIFPQSI